MGEAELGEKREERDFTTESAESTEKSKPRSDKAENAEIGREEDGHDFAGIGVYGWEGTACARVVVF